jgi:3-hydroxyacyl-CoA dehydrogenase
MKPLRRAAVLGAGTMGARIAAHFANAGFGVDLLDVVAAGQPDRNAAALAGIEAAAKHKPAAFYSDPARALIAPGNFEDHLERLGACDWILEAVAENLEIKRGLLGRVAAARALGTIVSTNTSGIPLAQIAENFPAEMNAHFLGTHFFNPPRYLHLVEVIPGPATAPEVLESVSNFCDLRLGKGVVKCKDTPNFIANRIGCFFGATIHKLAWEGGYTVEEVDALTGPLIGLPRSASFRLVDIIGLDVWAHVLRNLSALAPDDPGRDRYGVPEFMERMIERGWLGEKRGQGFYKRVGRGADKEIHAIDLKTLEYHPAGKPCFAAVDRARSIEDLPQRLRALAASGDRAGRFVWNLLRDLFLYSAAMTPRIAHRLADVDRAICWGYNFTLGPFEMWDALGVSTTVERMRDEGCAVPESVERLLASGGRSFYESAGEGAPEMRYFDLAGGGWRKLEPRPGVVVLSDVRRARGVVRQSDAMSLVDLGEGALCLEFQPESEEAPAAIHAALEETERNFAALVIVGRGENFCAGMDLKRVLAAALAGEWNGLDAALARSQQANLALKYVAVPVVAALSGSTLGPGCAVALHAATAQAAAETYMGFTEIGAGLIPAGGVAKEMLLRAGDIKAAYDPIQYARTSSSAAHAREMGLLRRCDGISINPERLLGDAKAAALARADSFAPAVAAEIPVSGDPGYASLKIGLFLASEAGYISEYDAVVGEKLAHVLSGGRLTGAQRVSEQYLLDLEREAFLSLCGQAKTQVRMEYLLKNGKPLKN